MSETKAQDEMLAAYVQQIKAANEDLALCLAAELFQKGYLRGEASLAARLRHQLSMYDRKG